MALCPLCLISHASAKSYPKRIWLRLLDPQGISLKESPNLRAGAARQLSTRHMPTVNATRGVYPKARTTTVPSSTCGHHPANTA
eukprot:1181455-Prorocentrum_minimum.AAC.3